MYNIGVFNAKLQSFVKPEKIWNIPVSPDFGVKKRYVLTQGQNVVASIWFRPSEDIRLPRCLHHQVNAVDVCPSKCEAVKLSLLKLLCIFQDMQQTVDFFQSSVSKNSVTKNTVLNINFWSQGNVLVLSKMFRTSFYQRLYSFYTLNATNQLSHPLFNCLFLHIVFFMSFLQYWTGFWLPSCLSVPDEELHSKRRHLVLLCFRLHWVVTIYFSIYFLNLSVINHWWW